MRISPSNLRHMNKAHWENPHQIKKAASLWYCCHLSIATSLKPRLQKKCFIIQALCSSAHPLSAICAGYSEPVLLERRSCPCDLAPPGVLPRHLPHSICQRFLRYITRLRANMTKVDSARIKRTAHLGDGCPSSGLPGAAAVTETECLTHNCPLSQ